VASKSEIAGRLAPIQEELARLAASFATGKIIHSGLTLAIVGRPNVGKSSLFNCLVEQDRAIVTASPGTTRDLVAETVEIEGVPLRFVDTAGVREVFDEAESIGVRKSFEAAADGDLALLVLNGAEGLMPDDRDLLARLAPLGKLLVTVNKSDLPQRLSRDELTGEMARLAGETGGHFPMVSVSALRGTGIAELRRAILDAALPALSQDRESQFLTNARQERRLVESLEALEAARKAFGEDLPHEMLLLDLYRALRPLDAITGQTTVEDILGNIFSSFCIGK
jgi:tRNA modification GTPase